MDEEASRKIVDSLIEGHLIEAPPIRKAWITLTPAQRDKMKTDMRKTARKVYADHQYEKKDHK
jgi:hypothetical protein